MERQRPVAAGRGPVVDERKDDGKNVQGMGRDSWYRSYCPQPVWSCCEMMGNIAISIIKLLLSSCDCISSLIGRGERPLTVKGFIGCDRNISIDYERFIREQRIYQEMDFLSQANFKNLLLFQVCMHLPVAPKSIQFGVIRRTDVNGQLEEKFALIATDVRSAGWLKRFKPTLSENLSVVYFDVPEEGVLSGIALKGYATLTLNKRIL